MGYEFTRLGITWRREWLGDNAGWYLWTSDCGRLKVRRHGSAYVAQVDGRRLDGASKSLLEAMDQALLRKGLR